MKNSKLFFAIFPRVSTEAQAVRGRSLEVQTKAMEEAAGRFGGKIVDNYGGQDRATPDTEHTKMEELLAESYLPFGKRKWNSIMFFDNSRFSRDNRKASEYIEIFKENNIRFFTIGQELNLFDPDDIFMLSIHTITGQHQAMKGSKKSMEARILGARQGKFTAGQPPFGRWRDKEGKLHIIEKDKKLIETAAKLYLKEGKGVIKISEILGMNASTLQRAFKHAGDNYDQKFKSERFGIDESIPTKIPPTLDDLTWNLIKDENAKRRVYHPGFTTSERLLCSYVFCHDCNKRLTVQEQTTHKRKKTYKYIYYRHEKCSCGDSFSIKGGLLEDVVIKSICGILNNSKKFKQALLKEHPTENQRKSLKKELSVLHDSIERIERKVTNLLNKMEDGIKMKGLQERIDKRNEEKNDIVKRMEEIENRLSSLPTEKEIESYRKLLMEKVKKLDLKNLTHKQKRQLIEMFCRGGQVGQGKRQAGVYVWRTEEAEEPEFSFAIIGLLGSVLGYIDEYPFTQIDHREDKVNVEKLRLDPSMKGFKAYIGTN